MTMRNIFTREELTDREYDEKVKNNEIDEKDWVDSTFYQEKD